MSPNYNLSKSLTKLLSSASALLGFQICSVSRTPGLSTEGCSAPAFEPGAATATAGFWDAPNTPSPHGFARCQSEGVREGHKCLPVAFHTPVWVASGYPKPRAPVLRSVAGSRALLWGRRGQTQRDPSPCMPSCKPLLGDFSQVSYQL